MLILQALFTALLSGLFSGLILFGLNEKRDRAEARLKKVEDAIEAHHAWYDAAMQYIDSHWAFGFHDNHDEAERLRTEADRRLVAAAAKANMLRGIYMPGQQVAAITILTCLRDFAEKGRDIRQGSIEKRPYEAARFEPIRTVSLAMIQSVRQAEEMYDVARAIANRPLLLRRYRLPKIRPRTPAGR
jgi:hypothetical protein